MSAVAGRVLLLFMGDYDSATTYKPMDVVLYGVNSYVCLLESTNNVPTNTTYWQTLAKGISNVSPEALGIGYGISQNTGASKTATLADYTLTINGIVAVTFADDVPANATLNINSQGAKPIYFRGSAIVANVIKGGDTVTFAYDGTHYDILCIDGGAGHKILNSAGTELTQRDALQASDGLEFVDDSTNQRTKVKMYLPIVPRATWDAMTEQEQIAYKASHYRFGVEQPDTSGVINAEYMKLLWENPNTTQAFSAQTITLNSADYDLLEVVCRLSTSDNYSTDTFRLKKGQSCLLAVTGTSGSAKPLTIERYFNCVSDTSYSFTNGSTQRADGSRATDNNQLIPIAVYGIKLSVQFKVNAIATELSTRADHCFLDDEVTTVEDALTYKDIYSTTEHIVGKWIDGSVLYEKTISCGALPNATSKLVAHGISNLKHVVEIYGIGFDGNNSITLPRSRGDVTYIDIFINNTNVVIGTGFDYSGTSNSYVTIRYTKTV